MRMTKLFFFAEEEYNLIGDVIASLLAYSKLPSADRQYLAELQGTSVLEEEIFEELITCFIKMTSDIPVHAYDFTEWLEKFPLSNSTKRVLNKAMKSIFKDIIKFFKNLTMAENIADHLQLEFRNYGKGLYSLSFEEIGLD